jgi:hypothetical protein
MIKGFRNFVRPLQVPLSLVVAFVAFLWYSDYLTTVGNKNAAQRQQVVCPSFLSIARSARDTLIVMRNEPLCNSYVLDNLQ